MCVSTTEHYFWANRHTIAPTRRDPNSTTAWSYLCTHEMWPCVGWLVRAWARRHLKTTSPHWKQIFVLFSQNAKTRQCVGSSMFDPSGSQCSYLSIWLCIQAGVIPPGGNKRGDGGSSSCSHVQWEQAWVSHSGDWLLLRVHIKNKHTRE